MTLYKAATYVPHSGRRGAASWSIMGPPIGFNQEEMLSDWKAKSVFNKGAPESRRDPFNDTALRCISNTDFPARC